MNNEAQNNWNGAHAEHGDANAEHGETDARGPHPDEWPAKQETEISGIADLFLSEVREKARGDRVRPVRTPPGRIAPMEVVPAEVVPTEVVEVAPVAVIADAPVEPSGAVSEAVVQERIDRPAWLLLSPHLSDEQRSGLSGRVARAIVGGRDRAGVLVVRIGGVSLELLDPELPGDANAGEPGSLREIELATGELSAEVKAWVVDLGPADGAAAGEALVAGGTGLTWVVPVLGGDDDMVGVYRTLKALAGMETRGRLVLACAGHDAIAWANRLRAVMRKFLQWDAADALVLADDDAAVAVTHPLMTWEAGETEDPESWRDLVGRLMGVTAVAGVIDAEPEQPSMAMGGLSEPAADWGNSDQISGSREDSSGATQETITLAVERKAEPVVMAPPVVEAASAQAAPHMTLHRDTDHDTHTAADDDGSAEVYDLQGTGDLAVLDAVVRGSGDELRPCGVNAPGTLASRLVAEPSGRIVLLAAVGGTVAELAEVGRVVGWLRENAALLARACPEAEIDPALEPAARLYVTGDRARNLSTLLSGTATTVHTYLPLRWGERRGVVLRAA